MTKFYSMNVNSHTIKFTVTLHSGSNLIPLPPPPPPPNLCEGESNVTRKKLSLCNSKKAWKEEKALLSCWPQPLAKCLLLPSRHRINWGRYFRTMRLHYYSWLLYNYHIGVLKKEKRKREVMGIYIALGTKRKSNCICFSIKLKIILRCK